MSKRIRDLAFGDYVRAWEARVDTVSVSGNDGTAIVTLVGGRRVQTLGSRSVAVAR